MLKKGQNKDLSTQSKKVTKYYEKKIVQWEQFVEEESKQRPFQTNSDEILQKNSTKGNSSMSRNEVNAIQTN